MRIGILGGTGPAGSGARRPTGVARLSTSCIGSRSKYRAMEARRRARRASGPTRRARSTPATTPAPPTATSSSSPRRGTRRPRTAQENEDAPRGQGRHLDGQRARAGRTRSSSRSCRRAAASPPTCRRPCRGAASSPRSTTCRPRSSATSTSRSTPTCSICGDDPAAVATVSEIVAKIPGCRPLDAGELSNATAIEAFTAVLLQLNVRYKTRVAPKLTGIKRDPRGR